MPLRERTALKVSRDLRRALILYRVRTGTAAEKQTVVGESVVEVEFPSVGVEPLLASYLQDTAEAGANLLVGAERAKAAPTWRRA
jgi:hypothetical protein